MKKSLIAAVLMFGFSICAFGAGKFESWNHVTDEMVKVLNEADVLYAAGNVKAGKDTVDKAYFGYYEKLGFEKTVMAYISGDSAARTEYQFALIKKSMTASKSPAEVKKEINTLCAFLREDANKLDGKGESALSVFLASLLIITREGFEAIIIVGAILAYLRRSGRQEKARIVYGGVLIAIAASIAMAFVLTYFLSGAKQEIIEGFTMLAAVAVLFYVSNWMISKSQSKAWAQYIESKARSSVEGEGIFSLAFASFLAVFREGAETILFYKAQLANVSTYFNMVWFGLAAGVVALVIIYMLIHFLSLKIPIKPFFIGTSILLFIMALSFTGSAIKELQEGNLVGVTPVGGVQSVDLLGIYPTMETLAAQLILLAIAAFVFAVYIVRRKKHVMSDKR
jgi:high-affinity iron transporter